MKEKAKNNSRSNSKSYDLFSLQESKNGSGNNNSPIEREDEILLITDIPARICVNCGEAYLEEDTSLNVQALANKQLSSEISYADSSDRRKVSVLLYAA